MLPCSVSGKTVRHIHPLLKQIVLFLFLYCMFYFGTLAVIGFAAPGKYYSPFIQQHLDYVSWLKSSLLWGVKGLLGAFGYSVTFEPDFVARINKRNAVLIAYDCVGYGVYSFWLAYSLSSAISWKAKILAGVGGLMLLWMINVVRISFVLLAPYKGWPMPFGMDHHTLFNIVAYTVIIGMIILMQKIAKKELV